GGTFIDGGLGGDYGCSKSCGDGGTCEVLCDKEGSCEGSCPSCGERRQRRGPVPVLRGANAAGARPKQLGQAALQAVLALERRTLSGVKSPRLTRQPREAAMAAFAKSWRREKAHSKIGTRIGTGRVSIGQDWVA